MTEIYLSIVSGLKALNYAQIYLNHSDFALLFRTLQIDIQRENRSTSSIIEKGNKSVNRVSIFHTFSTQNQNA